MKNHVGQYSGAAVPGALLKSGEIVAEDNLIDRALNNDRTAAEKLIHILSPVIRASIRQFRRRRTTCADDDWDLYQAVWEKLFSKNGKILKQYNVNRGMGLKSFVAMVAKREIGNLFDRASSQKRRAPMEAAVALGEDASWPFLTIERSVETRDLLLKLLPWLDDNLSSVGLKILYDAYWLGLSADEIAVELGISVQVVYNWQHRIRYLSRRFIVHQVDV